MVWTPKGLNHCSWMMTLDYIARGVLESQKVCMHPQVYISRHNWWSELCNITVVPAEQGSSNVIKPHKCDAIAYICRAWRGLLACLVAWSAVVFDFTVNLICVKMGWDDGTRSGLFTWAHQLPPLATGYHSHWSVLSHHHLYRQLPLCVILNQLRCSLHGTLHDLEPSTTLASPTLVAGNNQEHQTNIQHNSSNICLLVGIFLGFSWMSSFGLGPIFRLPTMDQLLIQDGVTSLLFGGDLKQVG